MKLTILSRYGRLGASSRLRTLQYVPYLEKVGFQVEVLPFFSDQYLIDLYDGQRRPLAVAEALVRRLKQLKAARNSDLVWIEKESLPWLPWKLESLLLDQRIPFISDYDDAVFHRYDQHKLQAIRSILGTKIGEIMGASKLVTAGNEYLAEKANSAGAPAIKIVPTVVDVTAYNTTRKPPLDGFQRIGWIGTPGTWKEYGVPMMPTLNHLTALYNAKIRTVGAGKAATPAVNLEVLPWSEDTEVSLIQTMAVGIMPLNDSSWSRGKCGYKLIQYMACGVPVVASPVGVNSSIVDHGVNGYIAETDEDWEIYIGRLLSDPDLSARMGLEGRKKVEQKYSIQLWGPEIAKTFHSLALNK